MFPELNVDGFVTADPLNLVWIDLEMTGLNTTSDGIIEVATVVTSPQLQILDAGHSLVVHQPDEVLDAMDEWNQRQHGESNLIEEVRYSNLTYAEVEAETLAYLKRFAVAGKSPMCGNSVCQDRRFLARLMPDLESFFHYRNLDVSTLKELALRWKSKVLEDVEKNSAHRALADVYASIEELKIYRRQLMKL